MLAKSFGRRAAPPAAAHGFTPAGPDPDGVTRIIPKAVWDGPNGALLRRHGFSPDDPANLALTVERMRALEDEATTQMNALVARVNAHIPGVAVLPWAMIPWTVWKDANAEFLMKAHFFPSSPWNNMLLAADEKSAAFLGLPEHPRAAIPAIDENVTRLIDELRVRFRDEIDRGIEALSRGDFSVLDQFEKRRTERFQKLFMLTRHVANLVFGEAVCARHDELFGIGLKEVTG